MPIAFHANETMKGTHHFVTPALGPPTDRPCWFRLRWGAPLLESVNPFSSRFLRYDASGVFVADRLTDGPAACSGSLELDYFGDLKITYDLCFQVAGARYRFRGEKRDVDLRRPLQLIKTHTTCYGAITDDTGNVVSKSVLHFAPENLREFVASMRLARE